MMAHPCRIEDFTFFQRWRVRWAEVDPQGIVFNPNYFVYFDTAITEYQRAIGFPYPSGLKAFGTDTFAVNATADFRASALFDDELDLGVRVAQIGRTSLKFTIGVFRRGELLVEGALVYVNATIEGHAPRPWPEPFLAAIRAFERVAPAPK